MDALASVRTSGWLATLQPPDSGVASWRSARRRLRTAQVPTSYNINGHSTTISAGHSRPIKYLSDAKTPA
ncbi:jg10499 [Pararge aegeria aegeria]|uniref:Jg10499 protein n=1 Tax=Pararge aegeria aegeria TaxID=348720 RepID=A0A8S4RML0_9NEOP|nr:jg10499 [Pararge aegeria aegeria]